jgi:hypothetical protein
LRRRLLVEHTKRGVGYNDGEGLVVVSCGGLKYETYREGVHRL